MEMMKQPIRRAIVTNQTSKELEVRAVFGSRLKFFKLFSPDSPPFTPFKREPRLTPNTQRPTPERPIRIRIAPTPNAQRLPPGNRVQSPGALRNPGEWALV